MPRDCGRVQLWRQCFPMSVFGDGLVFAFCEAGYGSAGARAVSAAEVPPSTQMSAATLLAGPNRLLLLGRDEGFEPQMFLLANFADALPLLRHRKRRTGAHRLNFLPRLTRERLPLLNGGLGDSRDLPARLLTIRIRSRVATRQPSGGRSRAGARR